MKQLLLPLCLLFLTHASLKAQEQVPHLDTARAFAGFVLNEDQAPADFLLARLSPKLLERIDRDVLIARLETFRARLQGSALEDIYPDGPVQIGLIFQSRTKGEQAIVLRTTEGQGRFLTDVWFEGGFRLDPEAVEQPLPPPLTWDNFDERMSAEVLAGFSGAILITRDGKTMLDKGYGMANREQGIACDPKTIFASGSVPIDYTKAGVLLLVQDEMIDFDQTITDFFKDVPDDKRDITISHLMNGQSGLHDFHGDPSDSDPDHFWIDREQAINRILSRKLLFEPGKGRQHSHSAWGLLAAIIEIVSETSYQDFTTDRMFKPAGMLDTGFNGDRVSEERLAVGYGFLSDGKVNAPPFWGPTSWLVLGSGGMTSTTHDMLRWQQAMRRGDILDPEWARRYWSGPGVFAAGDVFGFEVNYAEEQGRQFVLLSNSIEGAMRRRFSRLGREISRLP